MENGLESKSLALIRIYQILFKYSDINHPLKQEDIKKYLERDYCICVDRKNIGRKVLLLKEALEKDNIYLISTKNGTYLEERVFDDSEIKLLIDGVLSSRYITDNHSKKLIQKLCGLSNKYFKPHIKSTYSLKNCNKTNNSELFLNIEIIDEAIETKNQIKFHYNRYCLDKKLHFTKEHIASPYQLFLHNQRYYLMAFDENRRDISYFRIDHISNMSIEKAELTDIKTIDGYNNGINFKDLLYSRPYMFTDKSEKIEFMCDKNTIDDIVDWFGYDFQAVVVDDRIKITLYSSPKAVEYWAMQYLKYVEVITPQRLRDKIKKNILTGASNYFKDEITDESNKLLLATSKSSIVSDELKDKVKQFLADKKKISATILQRDLLIGYPLAKNVIYWLIDEGYIERRETADKIEYIILKTGN